METRPRGPIALIRDPLITITASAIGAPPLPSITVAPAIAIDGCGCAEGAAPESISAAARPRSASSLKLVIVVNPVIAGWGLRLAELLLIGERQWSISPHWAILYPQ